VIFMGAVVATVGLSVLQILVAQWATIRWP
jgi:hypothetical protein